MNAFDSDCHGCGLVAKSCRPTLATLWTVMHQAPLSMGIKVLVKLPWTYQDLWVWVDQSEIHFAWLITSSDQLTGSKALPPGLELAFIFRGNEVEHLGLGPQSLGFLALGNFPGGLWFLFIKYTLESHDGVLHALSWAVNKEMMVNKLRCCLSLPLEMVCLADKEHCQGVSGELSLVFLQLLIHSFCTLE